MNYPKISALRGALCALVALGAVTASRAEKPEGAKEKGPSAALLKKYDANQDGKLDETEKAALEADLAKKKAAEEAKVLAKYDANKDGKLDDSEKAAMEADKKAAAEKRKEAMEKKKAEKEKAKAGTGDGK